MHWRAGVLGCVIIRAGLMLAFSREVIFILLAAMMLGCLIVGVAGMGRQGESQSINGGM